MYYLQKNYSFIHTISRSSKVTEETNLKIDINPWTKMWHSWTKSRTSPNAEMIWQAFNTEHFIYLSVGLSTVPLQTHAITLLPPPIILVQVNIGFLCPCFVYFRI